MLQKIRIGGVPEPFNIVWQEPIEGALWSEWKAGSGALCQALLSRDIDAAFVLTESAVFHGLTIHLVQTQTPLVWGVFGKNGSAFRAGRVAVSRFGSGSHLMAMMFLAENGYGLDGVQFLPMGSFEAMCQAVEAEQADFFLWEKNFTLSHKQDLNQYAQYQAQWPAFVLATASEFQDFDALNWVLKTYFQRLIDLHRDKDLPNLIATKYRLSRDLAAQWLLENKWNLEVVKLQSHVYQYIADSLQKLNYNYSKIVA